MFQIEIGLVKILNIHYYYDLKSRFRYNEFWIRQQTNAVNFIHFKFGLSNKSIITILILILSKNKFWFIYLNIKPINNEILSQKILNLIVFYKYSTKI